MPSFSTTWEYDQSRDFSAMTGEELAYFARRFREHFQLVPVTSRVAFELSMVLFIANEIGREIEAFEEILQASDAPRDAIITDIAATGASLREYVIAYQVMFSFLHEAAVKRFVLTQIDFLEEMCIPVADRALELFRYPLTR